MTAAYTAPRWFARLLGASFGLQLWQVLGLCWQLRFHPGPLDGRYILALYLLTPLLLLTGLGALLQWRWWRRSQASAPISRSSATGVFVLGLLTTLAAATGWALLSGGL